MTTTLPPGPKGKPFIGNLLEFRRDPIGFIMSLARDFGDISHFRIPISGSVYFINRPEYIKDVLADRSRIFRKSSDYDLLKAIVGEGLLTSEGDFHKRQRRLALPAFHRQRISAYGAVMTEYC